MADERVAQVFHWIAVDRYVARDQAVAEDKVVVDDITACALDRLDQAERRLLAESADDDHPAAILDMRFFLMHRSEIGARMINKNLRIDHFTGAQ